MFGYEVSGVMAALALLAIRIVLVITFASQSRMKLKDIKAFSKNDGVPVPISFFVAIAEAAAALSMLSGILAPYAGIGIMLLMIGTTSMHLFKWHSSYSVYKRGWEYDVIMFVLAFAIVVFGPGSLALHIL